MSTRGTNGRDLSSDLVSGAGAVSAPLTSSLKSVSLGSSKTHLTAVVARKAPVTLFRPKRDHVYDYHSALLSALDGPDCVAQCNAFLASFQSNRARQAWLSSLDKEHGLSHVIGDIFTKNSYEGWIASATLSVVAHMVQAYQELLPTTGSDRLRDQLSRINKLLLKSVELASYCASTTAVSVGSYIARNVEALSPGDSYLIPGGVRGGDEGPGHAVLYMVTKNHNGTFAFEEYNTGAGTENASSMVKDVVKRRFKRLAYNQIPQEILLKGPGKGSFFQALMEPHIGTNGHSYKMSDVHTYIFPELARYRVSENGARYFSAQVAGTCSFQSIMAWLHFELDEPDYKLFATWQKSHVLLLVFSEWLKGAFRNSEDTRARPSLNPTDHASYLAMPSHQQRLLTLSSDELFFHIKGRLLRHVASGAEVPSVFKEALSIARLVQTFVQGLHDARAIRLTDADKTIISTHDSASSAQRLLSLVGRTAAYPTAPYDHVAKSTSLNFPVVNPLAMVDTLEATLLMLQTEGVKVRNEQLQYALSRWIIDSIPSLEVCQTLPSTMELSSSVFAIHSFLVSTGMTAYTPDSLGRNFSLTITAASKLLAWLHHITKELFSPTELTRDKVPLSRLKYGGWSKQTFDNHLYQSFKDRYALVLDPSLRQTIEETCNYFIPFSTASGEGAFEKTDAYYSSFTLAANSSHAQVRFWHDWIEGLSMAERLELGIRARIDPVEAAHYRRLGEPVPIRAARAAEPAEIVIHLMNGSGLPKSHPTYAVYLFRQAYHGTSLLLNGEVSQSDRAAFRTGSPALKLLLEKRYNSDDQYKYYVGSFSLRGSLGQLSVSTFGKISDSYRNVIDLDRGEFDRIAHNQEETPILRRSHWLSSVDERFVKIMERGQSEPLQNASLLLTYFKEQLEKLENPQLCKLFFLSFFKTDLIRKGASSGFEVKTPLAENLRNKVFIAQLRDFFDEVFTHFVDRQAGSVPNYAVCSFVATIEACCRYVASREHAGVDVLQGKLGSKVQAYLAKVDGKADYDIQMMAHLCQVLTNILIPLPDEKAGAASESKDGEAEGSVGSVRIQQALISWIKYCAITSRVKAESRSPWLEKIVMAELLQMLPSFASRAEVGSDVHAIARALFKSKLPRSIDASHWKLIGTGGSAAFKAIIPSTSSYLIIDFVTGTLANENGILTSGLVPDFFGSSFFQEIFGEETPQYELAGQTVLITHKDKSFKTRLPQTSSYYHYTTPTDWISTLQIQDKDGRWLDFVPFTQLQQHLPHTLAKRYWFFYDRAGASREIIGFSRSEFAPQVKISPSGVALYSDEDLDATPLAMVCRVTTTVNADDGDDDSVLMPGLASAMQASSIDTALIARIEKPEFAEIEITSSGRQLVLPRFQLWGGNKLRFIEDGTRWHYAFSQTYWIDFSQQSTFFSWTDNYITLVNAKNDRMILVPVCSWKISTKLGSGMKAQLDPSGSYLLDGTIHYMEYHVDKEGKLHGSTLEAKLYLALLWLLQKEFSDAYALLKSLPTNELKGSAGLELVSSVVDHSRKNPDFGPESTACLILFCAKNSSLLSEKIKEELKGLISPTQKWLHEIYEHYVHAFERVSDSMKLPGSEELVMIRNLNLKGTSVGQFRFNHLQAPVTHSAWTIQEVAERESLSVHSSYGISYSTYGYGGLQGRTLPRLAAPDTDRTDYIGLNNSGAGMLLLAHTAPKENLDHLKLYIQIQLRLRAKNASINPQFLALLASMIYQRESGSHQGLSSTEFDELLTHIRIANNEMQLDALVPKIPGEKLEDHEARKNAYRLRFHGLSSRFISGCSSHLPRLVNSTLVADGSALGERGPVHGKHAIEWYKGPDLRACVETCILPSPAISSREMSSVFKLTPFDKLELEEAKAMAKARKDTEIDAVAMENELFLQDLSEGKRKIEERYKVETQSDQYDALMAKIETETARLSREAKAIELRVCNTLNKMPTGSEPGVLAELSGRLHGETTVHTIEDAVCLFLIGRRDEFLDANPLLTEAEITDLMRDVFQWLMLQTDYQHLVRIKGFGKDYQENKESLSGAFFGEMLYTSCESKREYDPHQFPELLVFEYFSKMRLREQQGDLIQKMLRGEAKYDDATAQLIMGGGKTSVLATILLVVAASKGLAYFVTPASQFATVKENLAQSMRQCLKRGLVSLSIERADLKGEQVEELYRTLDEARRLGKPVMTKAETLQSIELEFVTSAIRLTQIQGTPAAEDIKVLEGLAKICDLSEDEGQMLIDEVDLVLHTLKEVNFPGGVVSNMAPDRVEMMAKLYEVMGDASYKVEIKGETKSLRDWTQVTRVLDEEYNIDFFSEHLVPVIVRQLAIRHGAMKVPAEHLDSFVKFCLGQFKGEPEGKDLAFKKYLQDLHGSKSHADQDAANQIALAKHLVQDVLTTTLSRSCGRNFGRTRGEPAGKCVPYQCSDRPSTSEFGYHYEAACYQFQTAMQRGIQEEQIVQLAKVFNASAINSARVFNCLFNATPEAIEFKQLTGIDLHEVSIPEKLASAVTKLETERKAGKYDNLLKIEAETILTCVTYHAHRVSSGPQSFLSMVASRRAFSGTPSNVETYPLSMKKSGAYLPDLGTEGQIIATMLDRDRRAHQTGNSLVHGISDADPVEMITKVMRKYPEAPERVSMLLDPSGLFKGLNNKQVAFKVRDFLRDDSSFDTVDRDSGERVSLAAKFKGVLFFTRPQKAEEKGLFNPDPSVGSEDGDKEHAQATPDTLAFLPMNSDTLIYIKGTSIEELARHGLNPGEYFVIDDESHTTGTDIRMKPDAVAVMTMDETLTKPRMCQAVMRLRQYLYTQDLHTVMLESTLKRLGIEAPTAHDVIALSNRAQALEKYRVMARSFNQKIDNYFRHFALKRIRQAARKKDTAQVVRETKELMFFLTYQLQDEPYALFAGQDEEVPTVEHLEGRFNKRLALLEKALTRLGVDGGSFSRHKSEAESVRASLLEEARGCKFLPRTQKVLPVDAGVEQEVEQVTEVEVVEEVDQTIENQTEIRQDLDQINLIQAYGVRSQLKWTKVAAGSFLTLIKGRVFDSSGTIPGGATSRTPSWNALLPSYLKPFESYGFAYRKTGPGAPNSFKGALFKNLLCTDNQRLVATSALPIFHKDTRPFDRLLIVQIGDGEFSGIAISLEESQFWKEYIEGEGVENVWMVDPEGMLLADSKSPLPTKEVALRQLLVQINALRGNISYLNANMADTRKWLGTADPFSSGSEVNTTSKIWLVKYSVLALGDPAQIKQFVESEVFNPDKAATIRRKRRRLLAHLNVQRSNSITAEKVRRLSPQEVMNLSDEDAVIYLTPEQVNYLPLDMVGCLVTAEQIQALDAERVPFVDPDMIAFLKEDQIPLLGNEASKLQRLIPEQVNHVTAEQVLLLDVGVYKNLTKPELIQALRKDQLMHISAAQVCHLKASQIALLPAKESLIQAITDVAHLRMLTASQMKLISRSQFNLLNVAETPAATIGLLGEEYAHLLLPALVRHLVKKEAIRALNTADQINSLVAPQLASLSDDQLFHLTSRALIAEITSGSIIASLNLAEVAVDLTEAQLNALPLAAVAKLPENEDVLKHLDEDHFEQLTEKQIQCLASAEQIARLTEAQLSHISREQFLLLDDSQIPLVKGDAVNAIAAGRVNLLTDEQVAYLTEPALVKALSDDKVNRIAEAVVDLLEDVQLSHLTSKTLIACLAQERIVHLGAAGFANLSEVQIALITEPDLISRLVPEQLKHLGDAALAALTDELLLVHLTDEQLFKVSAVMFGALSEARIRAIKDGELIAKLSAAQLEHVEDAQLVYATDETLLGIPQRVKNIPEARVKTIELVDLVEHLEDAQIQHLSIDTVKALTAADQIQRLVAAQINELQPSQVPHLKEEQLEHLVSTQVSHLVEAQVRVLPRALAKHVTLDQAKWVKADDVPELSTVAINGITVEQLASIDDTQIAHLTTQELIQALTEAQINLIGEAAVKHLTEAQLPSLTKAELVKEVSADETLLALLSDEALAHLTQAQVLCIEDEELLGKLPEVCLTHLSANQVKKLTDPDQISKLGETQVDHIDAAYVSHLTDVQVALLKDKDLIQALPTDKIIFVESTEHLTTAQLEELISVHSRADLIPDDRFDELSEETIQQLEAEYVQKLKTLEGLEKLSQEQLADLNQSQVATACQSERLAQLLPDDKLVHVPPALVLNLSQEQMALLTNVFQIQAIPVTQIQDVMKVMQPGQRLLLSQDQVAAITDSECVKLVAEGHEGYLPTEAWKYLNDAQRQRFMAHANVIRRKSKDVESFVAKIPADFFEQISKQVLEECVSSFMCYLTDEQKKKLSIKALRDCNMPAELITHLLPKQMSYVPKKLIPTVYGDGVAYVQDIYNLTEAQIQSIKDKEAVSAFCKRAPDLLRSLLSPSQVKMIDDPEYLDGLSSTQMENLNTTVVKKMTLGKLWLQPAVVLKKATVVQKMVLCFALAIQSFALTLASLFITFVLAPLCVFRAVRGLVSKTWGITGYSWRFLSIWGK